MPNLAIMGFFSGELSPKIDTRFDIEKYQRGCRILQNMIATKYGGAERRPGTYYIASSYGSADIVKMLEFIYSASVAYKIESTDYAFRFYFDDAILLDESSNQVVTTTPYEESDLFQLQYTQIGDVMWLVHSGYAQRTLSRTDPYTFEIEEIDFRKGPFLIRNDLLDLTITDPGTMTCSATAAGSYGTLVSSNSVFHQGHKGALFKLTHPRTTTIVEQQGDGTSDELTVKGAMTLVSRGTWTGTFYVQRKEQNAEWENFRSYKGNNNRNIIESWTEENVNVSFRIHTESGMSSKFRADISTQEGQKSGVVKIVGVGSSYSATVEVYSELDSTAATVRWAEGAWSGVRGYPASVTFFEDRCVYAGATTGSDATSTQEKDYPSLRQLEGV